MASHSKQTTGTPLVADDRSTISVGNAALTGREHGGWFIGHFISEEAGTRRTDALQAKWGLHRAGEDRVGLNNHLDEHSLAILISGRFVIEFPTLGEEVMLSQPGDYVLYGPGFPHSWRAVEDSTVLTVRWPATDSQ